MAVTLRGGPREGWTYTEADLWEGIRARQRMHRDDPARDPAAALLGYRPADAETWTWQGFNCHPAPAGDD